MSHLVTMVTPDGEQTYVSKTAVDALTARGYSVVGDDTAAPKKRPRKPVEAAAASE